MNSVREAPVTKSGNPLCDKSHVELILRVMLLGTEAAKLDDLYHVNEVSA